MGLDNYLYEVRSDMANGNFHYNVDRFCKPNEVQCWRRNWGLHRVMEKLYRLKGGPDEKFNGKFVRIVFKDLDFIESEIKSDHQKEEDYGWGSPEESLEQRLQIVSKIRSILEEGHSVYYTDSW